MADRGARRRIAEKPTFVAAFGPVAGGVLVPSTPPAAVGPPSSLNQLFNSPSFFRLWLAQVVSSLGDWIGLVAVTALAARIAGGGAEAAVGLVLSARLLPGFFFGQVAGVLVDRFDRKRVMVTCDVGRAVVIALLPLCDRVSQLFLASLLLEVMTLLWQPAKEASVPNLIDESFLQNANSMSLAAAYGTFPVGAVLFTGLASVAAALGRIHALRALEVSQESLALWVDTLTFATSAALISTLALPRRRSVDAESAPDRPGLRAGAGPARPPARRAARAMADAQEGWRFICGNAVVRSVIVALATGLIGGGLVVPLGPVFARDVLNAGTRGFGTLMTALGMGVAAGIIGLAVFQKRLQPVRVFVGCVVGSGLFLVLAASMSSLGPSAFAVVGFGVCGGGVYVLGFSLIQAHTRDELRGRTFATLYTLVRFCVLLAFVAGPLLSRALDALPISRPGTRFTLWLGGAIIVTAGVLAQRTLSRSARSESAA